MKLKKIFPAHYIPFINSVKLFEISQKRATVWKNAMAFFYCVCEEDHGLSWWYICVWFIAKIRKCINISTCVQHPIWYALNIHHWLQLCRWYYQEVEPKLSMGGTTNSTDGLRLAFIIHLSTRISFVTSPWHLAISMISTEVSWLHL